MNTTSRQSRAPKPVIDGLSWPCAPSRIPHGFIVRCRPTLASAPPSGPAWVHEIKHDGFRFVVRRDGERVRVYSRKGLDWSERTPSIVTAALALKPAAFTLDGEGVVFGPEGVSHFDALRSALARKKGCASIFLVAFDVLELDGRDLRREPWDARRTMLAKLLRRCEPGIQLSEHVQHDGPAVFRHACALGVEGIVSKRRNAPYRSGNSRDWIKVRNPNAPAVARVAEGHW